MGNLPNQNALRLCVLVLQIVIFFHLVVLCCISLVFSRTSTLITNLLLKNKNQQNEQELFYQLHLKI